ncbi:hypothetical protein SARC_12253 [Sphaeroforma arctica JP610]|uniref:Uncharacterized protein n=1 Tax=Sphaeroforma arctica JP610 TaxID=667725 RepID=A0A0L0FGQ2_9EUKA|nr:hypothetical protein SARC_12253 [Sphaeroforma arctica JP610]KNC75218.1 hypothetical protein SARC_12253 [Sphaeroforma arctica JP610]|eukprot:XP_014149120.1 hypothetical protein SARC_12253 [Sphaeroforma arctica JP610]
MVTSAQPHTLRIKDKDVVYDVHSDGKDVIHAAWEGVSPATQLARINLITQGLSFARSSNFRTEKNKNWSSRLTVADAWGTARYQQQEADDGPVAGQCALQGAASLL